MPRDPENDFRDQPDNSALTDAVAALNKTLTKQTKLAAAALKLDKLQIKMDRSRFDLIRRQTRATKKLAQAQAKMRKEASKSIGRATGGGLRLGLPAFLSAAAIIGATKALTGYVTQLARARDMAQALGGAFRDVNQYLPSKRDAEIWAEFAGQAFSNRFASSIEIEGLKNLRDILGKALGPDAGKALTLKLTESLQGSQAELQEFLAIASQNVPEALAAFQSADVENFSTALAASRQKMDELSQTAYTFETAWQQIKEQFESFITSFVEQHGGDIRQVTIDAAQGVIDLINAGRKLAADFGPIFDFMIAGFKQLNLYKDYYTGATTKRKREVESLLAQANIWNETAATAIKIAKEAKKTGDTSLYAVWDKKAMEASAKAQDLSSRANDVLNPHQYKPLELKLSDDFEKANLELTEVVDKSKEERKQLEGMATSAEKAALKISKINEALEVRDLQIALGKSRLGAAESSPLLFDQAFKRRMQLVGMLDAKRKELEAKLHAIMAQDKILKDDRMKALKIETEINNIIAERNQLLKQQQKGYLDAILAQAFAAGKFEKIIMSQDKNVAMALEKGIAKASPFLGRVGEDALKNNVDPFRWTGNAAIDQMNMDKWTEDLTEWMETTPTRGDREIITRIDETNRLLQQRNVIPPVPAERLGIEAGITLGGSGGGRKITGAGKGSKSSGGNSNDPAKLLMDAVGQVEGLGQTLKQAAHALAETREAPTNETSAPNAANFGLN